MFEISQVLLFILVCCYNYLSFFLKNLFHGDIGEIGEISLKITLKGRVELFIFFTVVIRNQLLSRKRRDLYKNKIMISKKPSPLAHLHLWCKFQTKLLNLGIFNPSTPRHPTIIIIT